MKDNLFGLIVLLAIWAVTWLCIGGALGEWKGRSAMRQAAIEAGVAKWVIDPNTGTAKFEFCK